MEQIRCPYCGSPVMVRGSRWECGYCGDCGQISSLRPAERAKWLAAQPDLQLSVRFVIEEAPSEPEESRLEPLLRAFPEEASRWTEEELAQMDLADLIVETAEQDPQAGVRMVRFLLDQAGAGLQDPQTAQQLLGEDLYDACLHPQLQGALLGAMEADDGLARQLFSSAYAGLPQQDLISACDWFGRVALKERLQGYLAGNSYA